MKVVEIMAIDSILPPAMTRASRSALALVVLSAVILLSAYLTVRASADDDETDGHRAGMSTVACPGSLVGLTLSTEHEGITIDEFGRQVFECAYYLGTSDPGGELDANITILWAESLADEAVLADCGATEQRETDGRNATGVVYSTDAVAQGQYHGRDRYAAAMRAASAALVGAVSDYALRCNGDPPPVIGSNVSVTSGEGETLSAPDGSGSGESSTPTEAAPDTGSVTGSQSGSGQTGTGTSSQQSEPTLVDGQPFECQIRGRVTDSLGVAVPGIHVALSADDGLTTMHTAAGPDGRYSFSSISATRATVTLVAEEFAHSPGRFAVFYQQALGALSMNVNDGVEANATCERNFDIWNLDENSVGIAPSIGLWPAMIQMYQNIRRAWDLADLAGVQLDYGLPLRVYGWCSSGTLLCARSADVAFAFYAGSTNNREIERPYIAFGQPTSQLESPGHPDNSEYHEFGHAFLSDFTGNSLNVNPGDVNHGGYYRNSSTTDSWNEGFAEFFSIMVGKHIDQESRPERYTIGADYDLEFDRKPWEAAGWWEEFTIAGLLLDFEDGDSDYLNRAEADPGLIVEQTVALSTPTGDFAIGKVSNQTNRVQRNTEVTVRLLDEAGRQIFTQVTAVTPRALAPGREGLFYVAAPAGLAFKGIEARFGALPLIDDDPIDVEFTDLLDALRSYSDNNGGQSVDSVFSLYQALSSYFSGRDLDGDGLANVTQDQIDLVFVNHGFFEDLDGDRRYDPSKDGQIGGSSHPGRSFGSSVFPPRDARRDPEPFPGSLVEIDSVGIAEIAVIQVNFPDAESERSYAYITDLKNRDSVELAVPPSGFDAEITVITVADGHAPAIALRVNADDFQETIEKNPEAKIEKQFVVLEPKQIFGDPDEIGSQSSWGIIGGTGALAVILLIGTAFALRRKLRAR